MNTIVTWTATGLVVGWSVRAAMSSRRDFGILGDLALGSLGGVVGGWVFKRLGVLAPAGLAVHIFVAVVGATTLVGGLRLLRRVVMAGVPALRTFAPADFDLDGRLARLSEVERRVLARVLRSDHPPADPNRRFDEQRTFGERLADRVAAFGGSWTFISVFLAVLVLWMVANTEMTWSFDPYPFILLNLVLSCVAALQAPIIMMSQNRQTAKDRSDARSDYEVNLRAEIAIAALHAKLDQWRDREWADVLTAQREQHAILQQLEQRLGALVGAGRRLPAPGEDDGQAA